MPDLTFRRFRLAAAVTWIGLGSAQLFGPDAWRASPSYKVIATILPLRVWGLVFVLVGLAQLAHHYQPGQPAWRLALIAGTAIAAAWASSFVFSALIGQLAGAGGPFLYGYLAATQAALAGSPLWHRHRRQRQRRQLRRRTIRALRHRP